MSDVLLICGGCNNDTNFKVSPAKNMVVGECLECGTTTKWGNNE